METVINLLKSPTVDSLYHYYISLIAEKALSSCLKQKLNVEVKIIRGSINAKHKNQCRHQIFKDRNINHGIKSVVFNGEFII